MFLKPALKPFYTLISLFWSSFSKSRKQEVWRRKPVCPEVRMVLDARSCFRALLCFVLFTGYGDWNYPENRLKNQQVTDERDFLKVSL